MPALIRAARPGDAPALAALFGQLGYPSTADAVRSRLAGPGADRAQVLVAEAEAEAGVVGLIVVNLVAPLHVAGLWALVSALVTDEAARGSGVGAALLDAAERLARERGCIRMELSSSEYRTRAHAFYLRHGFAEVRKRFVKAL